MGKERKGSRDDWNGHTGTSRGGCIVEESLLASSPIQLELLKLKTSLYYEEPGYRDITESKGGDAAAPQGEIGTRNWKGVRTWPFLTTFWLHPFLFADWPSLLIGLSCRCKWPPPNSLVYIFLDFPILTKVWCVLAADLPEAEFRLLLLLPPLVWNCGSSKLA